MGWVAPNLSFIRRWIDNKKELYVHQWELLDKSSQPAKETPSYVSSGVVYLRIIYKLITTYEYSLNV